MQRALAHTLSIVGHPALLMPAAVLASLSATTVAPETALAVIGLTAAVIAGVLIFSAIQVRRGQWRDSDASQTHERVQLNFFLAAALLGACVFAAMNDQPAKLVAGLGLAAAIVFTAIVLRTRLKLSLHVAFAVFAALLLWPNTLATGVLLALGAAVAWARLMLLRHTRADVIAGALAGAAAGVALTLY